MTVGGLKRNAVECVHCGTVVESTFRHDFRTHECVAKDGRKVWFAVDGGTAYLRRCGNPSDMRELFSASAEESAL